MLLIRLQVFLLHLPQLLCLSYNQSWISKDFSLFYPQFRRASILVIQASYSTILLVALKFNLIAKGMWDPSGVIMNTPIPLPYQFTAPLKNIFHAPSSMSKISLSRKSSLPSSPSTGFSTQKFDTTLPLIVFLTAYFKSNYTNKINHLDILSLKAGYSNRYFNRSILATIHIWKGRIMCLNFCSGHMSAKHDFSMGVYLVS